MRGDMPLAVWRWAASLYRASSCSVLPARSPSTAETATASRMRPGKCKSCFQTCPYKAKQETDSWRPGQAGGGKQMARQHWPACALAARPVRQDSDRKRSRKSMACPCIPHIEPTAAQRRCALWQAAAAAAGAAAARRGRCAAVPRPVRRPSRRLQRFPAALPPCVCPLRASCHHSGAT